MLTHNKYIPLHFPTNKKSETIEGNEFLNGWSISYKQYSNPLHLNATVWMINVVCKIMTPLKEQRRGVRNQGKSLSRVTTVT